MIEVQDEPFSVFEGDEGTQGKQHIDSILTPKLSESQEVHRITQRSQLGGESRKGTVTKFT